MRIAPWIILTVLLGPAGVADAGSPATLDPAALRARVEADWIFR